MTVPGEEDIYRSYGVVDSDETGDRTARMFVERYLRSWLEPRRGFPILDIGAGTGTTLRALQRAGFAQVEGVDSSASQVERARLLGTAVLLQGGLEALECRAPGSLGAIILLDVIEHLELKDLLELFRLAASRLTKGGVLVARAPNGTGLFGGAVRYGDLTHRRAYTPQSIAQAFALTGLEPVQFLAVRPMVHGLPSGLRALAWRAAEWCVRIVAMAESGERPIVTRNLLAIGRRSG